MKTKLLRKLRKQFYGSFYAIREKGDDGYYYRLRTRERTYDIYTGLDKAKEAVDRHVQFLITDWLRDNHPRKPAAYTFYPTIKRL